MQYPTMVMFNMTEPALEETHVAWNVVTIDSSPEDSNKKYQLFEVVRAKYRHPDAPNDAFVFNLELRNRGIVDASDLNASPYVIMYHAQNGMIAASCSKK